MLLVPSLLLLLGATPPSLPALGRTNCFLLLHTSTRHAMECRLLLAGGMATGSGKLWCRTVPPPPVLLLPPPPSLLRLLLPPSPPHPPSVLLLSLVLRDMRAEAGSDRLALLLLALLGAALAVLGCRGGSNPAAGCRCCSAKRGSTTPEACVVAAAPAAP